MRASVSKTPNVRYNYHHIFSGVCKTRFNHFARGLLWKIAVILGLICVIVGNWERTKMQKLMLWSAKTVSVYIGMLILIITRKHYMHVDYLGYTSWISTVYGQLFSVKWIAYQLVFTASASFVGMAFKSCFFDSSEYFNEVEMGYFSFCFYVALPFVYSVQHLLLDLDRLTFNYGAQHQNAQRYMTSKMYDSFLKCIVLNCILAVGVPVLQKLLFGFFFASFFTHLKTCGLTFITLQIWDFASIGFNAFLSIGCLHKGKPISSLSYAPIETLITGLKSERPFVKLTAFQELAYRSTYPNVELRVPIYYTAYKNVSIWPSILQECLAVIQTTNNAVADFLITLKKEIDPQPVKPNVSVSRPADHLFGTDYVVRAQTGIHDSRLPGAPHSEDRTSDSASHRIVLEDSNVFKNREPQRKHDYPKFTESYKQSVFTRQPTVISVLYEVWKYVSDAISQYFFTIDSNDSSKRRLSLFELYHISKIRESEKLCPIPVCYAECVNAMMGLIVNSVDEDPKGVVVSSVGEVLKILERSIGTLGSFTELELDGKRDKESDDIISILYDLCINAFLEIVLKYNTLLDEVYLDEDVVKLTEWLLKLSQDI